MTIKREVLYQKWRPKLFEDVVGQNHITVTLRNALIKDKFGHAYLFTGPRGVGKTSTARILAKALNSEIDDNGEPLLDTQISKDIDEGRFLDLIEIDAASNRRIDDIRSLLDSVQFMPSIGKFKVYIIDEVHMLTNEAFNALLKTLEEPPPRVIMILATTEFQKLPETIVSRCQRYDFRNVSDSDVVNRLKKISDAENIVCNEDVLWFIAENASGSLRDACNFLEQLSVAYDEITVKKARQLFGIIDENVSIEIFSHIIKNDKEKLIEGLQEIKLRGVDFRSLSSALIDALRLAIFTSNGVFKLQGYSDEYIKEVDVTFSNINSKKLLYILEKFLELISLRTEKFDVLLESSLLHLTYLFETQTQNSTTPNIIKQEPVIETQAQNITTPSMIKKEPVIETQAQNITTPNMIKQEPIIETQAQNITTPNMIKQEPIIETQAYNSEEKDVWEKVLFDLRRAKFGKMVLGGLLRNVEIPKKIEDKLILKFKSKYLHDLFKVEWKIDLAREAVKNSVIKIYGDKIKLVLEEPDEELQKSSSNKNILESSIVKSALALGAKIEEKKEG
jgi:DNA polymerase-3 subunit gamma/tau